MGIVTLVVIITSFIGTFFIIESPAVSRNKAHDLTRAGDLTNIKYAIDGYYGEYNKLPENLADLKINNAYLKLNDPITKQPYEYKIIDETSFQLCSEFEYSNKDLASQEAYMYGTEFSHEAGLNCFDRKINEYQLKSGEIKEPVVPEAEVQVIQ